MRANLNGVLWKYIFSCALMAVAGGMLSSCRKSNPTSNPAPKTDTTVTTTDTATVLKTAAAANGILFGIESDYPTVTTIPAFLSVIAMQANISTFGYEMKHGAIVQNNGTFNYTGTDAQYNAITGAGVGVFGHNLYWYANQNATYLSSIAGMGSATNGPNLVSNGDFENWTGSTPNGWSVYNQENGSFSQGSGTTDVESGNYSLEVNVTAAGQLYNSQIVSPSFSTVSGHTYNVSFYILATTSGGFWQLEAPFGVNYTGPQPAPTSWMMETYSFTGSGSDANISFDMGMAPGTFFIDNVVVTDVTAAAGSVTITPQTTKSIDSVLQLWISGPNGIVTRYAGRVKYWDVVNEPMSDETGGVRTSANTPIPTPRPPDWFFWADYLGREGAAHAFEYAHQADPNALLFVNDYNLEISPAKLDSLIAYVKELQADGAHIDGIGTEMHINYNTPQAGIDAAFQALAATGLKVKVSELDVRINPNSTPGFASMPVSATLLAAQAQEYQYVVSSYLKNVPASQRFAITVWGVDDKHSWYNTPTLVDFPLMYDSNFVMKPAFSGVLQALNAK